MQILIADTKTRIYPVPELTPVGMKAGQFFKLTQSDLIKLPAGSRLFLLPERMPIAYDPSAKCFTLLDRNPFLKKTKKCFAVAAFTPPGYTLTYNTAYQESGKPKILPLFSYAAAAFYKGEFYASVTKVDNDQRHDACLINIQQVKKNILKFRRIFKTNRLVRHLETCALTYGCANAENFFLSRYEAPLPVSPQCNANCRGCISYQPLKRCPVTQPRIKFIPTPEEVRDIALYHIAHVKNAIVSFGQGCEGEPLLAGDIIEQAIKLIRIETQKGIININTNASKPKIIARLFDAGLNSMRVSMNSVRGEYYIRYYQPRGYMFKDVLKSIQIAKQKNGFVSINYLTMPGFTDSKDEFKEFKAFIAKYRINFVQWRNLNYDPLDYFRQIKAVVAQDEMLGIKEIMTILKKDFPRLRMGYFNLADIY